MKKTFSLSALEWKLAGFFPNNWIWKKSYDINKAPDAEIQPIPVKVPGSVQKALFDAKFIPDWNIGFNYRDCEWIENRHWIFQTTIPQEYLSTGESFRLNCLGLDYSGWIYVNGKEAGTFKGSFTPYSFDISPFLDKNENILQIIFDMPPRWLGQVSYTSKITDWKPRFNYLWDWNARLVQTGIWDDIVLESVSKTELIDFRVTTSLELPAKTGNVTIHLKKTGGDCKAVCTLKKDGNLVTEVRFGLTSSSTKKVLRDIPVELWQPNGHGEQHLYELACELFDRDGNPAEKHTRVVGFRSIRWGKNPGAPEKADPWLCMVNSKPVFLQGVNWTPIKSNFADTSDEEYKKLLSLYKELGVTLLRVWGGSYPEKQIFYDLCDSFGIMIWQDFPLSSSGLENMTPADEKSREELCEIVKSYIKKFQHHPSLIMWCGGNELLDKDFIPLTEKTPLLLAFKEIVEKEDPDRRYVPTSPSGPVSFGTTDSAGKGTQWDVHGPYNVDTGELEADWHKYWDKDDSLFRSEAGFPSASPADILRFTAKDLPLLPGTLDNPLYRRQNWWIDWELIKKEHGREPANIEEYVIWSQDRQRRALSIAAETCVKRFPSCGGLLIWMGHDSFPCTANTSIIDFYGRPKPAALALKEIFKKTLCV